MYILLYFLHLFIPYLDSNSNTLIHQLINMSIHSLLNSFNQLITSCSWYSPLHLFIHYFINFFIHSLAVLIYLITSFRISKLNEPRWFFIFMQIRIIATKQLAKTTIRFPSTRNYFCSVFKLSSITEQIGLKSSALCVWQTARKFPITTRFFWVIQLLRFQ